MCVPPIVSKPKMPAPAPVEKEAEIERENVKQTEFEKREENMQKRVQAEIAKRRRGGAGQRSLFTGSKGGLGYYDQTLS
jgi:ribosomal protein L24|tara:strand:+ start:156 stop:392 length:237 start_codon:yes stop_codon:yes gene_type:complete